MSIYASAFLLGLLGAGHCFGMCGGISSALTFAIDKSSLQKRLVMIFGYNIGRITCYCLIGVIAGALGFAGERAGFPYFRVLAGLLIILMALYVSGVWRVLAILEQGGQGLWRFIQPIGQSLFPIKSVYAAFFLGALWGWLPCGLVYTAVTLSLSSASFVDGGVTMLLFGLGTLPAVVSGGLLADGLKAFLRTDSVRWTLAGLMLIFGVWTIFQALEHRHGAHTDHSKVHGNASLLMYETRLTTG